MGGKVKKLASADISSLLGRLPDPQSSLSGSLTSTTPSTAGLVRRASTSDIGSMPVFVAWKRARNIVPSFPPWLPLLQVHQTW